MGWFVTCNMTVEGGEATVAFGQERLHLFYLHDLFRGAAEESEKGFAEGLAQDSQSRECGDTFP